jgi:hypothetical protein
MAKMDAHVQSFLRTDSSNLEPNLTSDLPESPECFETAYKEISEQLSGADFLQAVAKVDVIERAYRRDPKKSIHEEKVKEAIADLQKIKKKIADDLLEHLPEYKNQQVNPEEG